MTDLSEPTVDSEAIRRMVLDALRILERVRQFPSEARTDLGSRWARHRVEGVQSDWDQLVLIMSQGRASYLQSTLDAFVGQYVPLSEAPPELDGEASQALDLVRQLNDDLDAVMPLLFDLDGDLRPELEQGLAATMRSVVSDL